MPERIQPRLLPDEFQALEEAVLRRLMLSGQSRFLIARDLALLSFLADTGLRASAFCALNIEDLNLETGVVTVQRGKEGKARALCILDDDLSEPAGGPTLRALRNYLQHFAERFGRVHVRALWVSHRGRRLTPAELRRILARLCHDAGVENRPPHAFRRGYFSAEYRARPTALPILRARMGWSPKSHEMINTYTRGAEIDLAGVQPQPPLSKRWRSRSRPTTPQGSTGGAPRACRRADRRAGSERGI